MLRPPALREFCRRNIRTSPRGWIALDQNLTTMVNALGCGSIAESTNDAASIASIGYRAAIISEELIA